jgi:nucleoside phosphorylase
MPIDADRAHVVVLAPMPLEMEAIVTAFGLHAGNESEGAPHTGRLGDWDVTAVHIGMGPPLTRAALDRLFEPSVPGHRRVDHVMIAGICGGLDRSLPVGTLINPEFIVAHSSGATYRHSPPGDVPLTGTLITTEAATLDTDLSQRFFRDGCIAVDMESSAVAEVCQAHRCAWSVYRCIGDRWFDGLLDQRIVDATNPDGSGNPAEIRRLLDAEPELGAKLAQLSRDTTRAARRAAEAAVEGLHALNG